MTVFTKCFNFNFQIGINPGMYAAFKGHHYAGPGNHFCKYQMLLITYLYLKSGENKVVKRALKIVTVWHLQLGYFRFSCPLSRTSCKITIVRQNVIKTCIFSSRSVYFIVSFFSGKCMFLSGLLPRPMSADDDWKLLQYGIGFTNIVERTTRGSSNLTRKEIEEGTFKRNS